MHFSSIAIGVGSAVMPSVVRQGALADVREVFGPDRVVGLEVARHVGEVDGHVDQVFPARAAGFQHRAHVGEHRARLCVDVVFAHAAVGKVFVADDRVGGRVARADAGQEQQVADAARMRIACRPASARCAAWMTSLMRRLRDAPLNRASAVS